MNDSCARLQNSIKNLLVVIVLFAPSALTLLGTDDKPLFAPRPAKDAKASQEHCEGAGIFQMIVDRPSGKVKEVFIRSSTKNVLLDADVINTFLQWRFKPNTASSVTIAVAFTADKDTAFYPAGDNIHARNRGIPLSFKEPIAPGKLWQWFSELYGAAGHR